MSPIAKMAATFVRICLSTAMKPRSVTATPAFVASMTVCRWGSALTKYPHHPNGRPELHAERIALEGQRNTAETAFSSLQVSFKQALRGSGRNRIESMETMEAMIWIALLTRSLLMLVDELDVATEGRRAA